MVRQPFLINIAITALFCFYSCQTTNKSTGLNTNSKRFPTKSNKEVTVLKRLNVSSDILKTLLIVPNSGSWIEIGRNMNYFREVMTIVDLQRDIIAKGLSDKVPSIS